MPKNEWAEQQCEQAAIAAHLTLLPETPLGLLETYSSTLIDVFWMRSWNPKRLPVPLRSNLGVLNMEFPSMLKLWS